MWLTWRSQADLVRGLAAVQLAGLQGTCELLHMPSRKAPGRWHSCSPDSCAGAEDVQRLTGRTMSGVRRGLEGGAEEDPAEQAEAHVQHGREPAMQVSLPLPTLAAHEYIMQ